MLKLIFSNIKNIMKNKNLMLTSILLAIFMIIFFIFNIELDNRPRVGIVDKDNTYTSNEIKNLFDNLEGVKVINIKESDIEIFLLTKQIDLAICINKNFEKNLISSNKDQILIKSMKSNNINTIIRYMIQLKCDDLSIVSSIDKENFKEINQDYNDTYSKLSLNDISEKHTTINTSSAILIFIMFILLIFIYRKI